MEDRKIEEYVVVEDGARLYVAALVSGEGAPAVDVGCGEAVHIGVDMGDIIAPSCNYKYSTEAAARAAMETIRAGGMLERGDELARNRDGLTVEERHRRWWAEVAGAEIEGYAVCHDPREENRLYIAAVGLGDGAPVIDTERGTAITDDFYLVAVGPYGVFASEGDARVALSECRDGYRVDYADGTRSYFAEENYARERGKDNRATYIGRAKNKNTK